MFNKVKVVCFGGGTGLPALLSNLKDNPLLDVTAVVNVTDNGGSSGELMDRYGVLPPGDLLKCLLALSKFKNARDFLLTRIPDPDPNKPGHSGGNMMLLSLINHYGFSQAIKILGELLQIQGTVAPVAVKQSILCAEYTDGTCHKGETEVDGGIDEGKRVSKLFLEPCVDASDEALAAIRGADVFCVGPGSFYTSLLPNFLPAGISDAMRKSFGKIIYIANLLKEGKGMQHMELGDFVETTEEYIGRRVDRVLVNRHLPSDTTLLERYAAEDKYPLIPEKADMDPRFALANLWLDGPIARHDSVMLAHAVYGLISRFSI